MRKVVIVIVSCTVVGLAGYAGYRSYMVWKQRHIMAMAREFHARDDTRNTLLSLRAALAANPRNIEAARLAAEILDANRSREALLWRSRVVELNPKSKEDRLALANTALVFHDFPLATSALEGVSEADKMTPAYHDMAGALALATQRLPEAREHFLQAVRLAPENNAGSRLNLSVVDIHGTNDAAIAEARGSLQRLSLEATNAALRSTALRELIADAMRFKRDGDSLALCDRLAQQTNAVFTDRLLKLEVLHDTTNSGCDAAMAALEREASTNVSYLNDLAIWQQAHGAFAEGLKWLQSLSPGLRTNQPAALFIAEFHAALKDWPGLQRAVERQNWAGQDFLRRALLARSLRGQDLVDSSRTEWELAVKAADDRKLSWTTLLNLAAQWGWKSESEELLWTMVRRYPEERWADQALAQILITDGRTRSLMALFHQEVKERPSDLLSKHNLAATALLLDAREYNPHELAREVYESAPTNSVFASTYAFSLLMQKRNAQALAVIEKMKPADLENPLIAGYYAIILQANGDRAKARKYLELAAKSAHLPEEKKLFDSARTRG